MAGLALPTLSRVRTALLEATIDGPWAGVAGGLLVSSVGLGLAHRGWLLTGGWPSGARCTHLTVVGWAHAWAIR
ncbi:MULTISPECIES: hypothetical protein [unclassified Frankia]|uniref:hypothetical protein n=2 Tax=Frankia TaxID=1854 RepID=UPI001EF52554|nr:MULTISPECIES: hypothetical protein [unclassified Frankia]